MFVKRERVEELERIAAEYEADKPFIEDARAIRGEVEKRLQEPGLYTAAQIAARAVKHVRELRLQEADAVLFEEYYEESKEELLEKLVDERRETDGARLKEEAKLAVDTNPKLAIELNKRAMADLGVEAAHEVVNDLKEAKRAAMEREKQRLIALNRLDVKLALEGELDLMDQEVLDLLEHGDKLKLYCKGHEDMQISLTLRWHVSDDMSKGWIYETANAYVGTFNANLGFRELNLKDTKYVIIGSLDNDMKTGDQKILWGKLKVGLPLGLHQGTMNKVNVHNQRNAYDVTAARIAGTDFQTKEMHFFGTPNVQENDQKKDLQATTDFWEGGEE